MSVVTQIKEVWNRLPMSGRVAVGAAAFGTLALIVALVYYGSQPEYAVLFSDLKPADAQAIVEKLKAANVAYSLSNSGTTVSVPAEKVAELRLQMAGAGVLSGGHIGFDLFDKTSFGATDFAQQVNYRRAIEGELAKTLEGLDEIESARVHITPQKESIFTEKAEGAKGSVMLRVKQGRELSNERTEAIVSLLASSVEGLDPSNISVMDTQGRLLTAAGRGKNGAFGDAGAFNAQLEAKQKFQAETASRIVSLLEPITGNGRVRADVAADVDFSQVEQTEEKYNPQSQVVRTQQTSQEVRNAPARQVPGVVGARANDPTTQQAAQNLPPTGANAGNDQRNATTTNYEIDKTIRKTLGGGGRISRLSVSVLVDHKTVEGVQTIRTPEEIKQMQDLVTAAVGADTQRGDLIVVQTMPFDQPQTALAPVTMFETYQKFVPSAIKYGALLLVAVLLLLFVIRPAHRALKAAATPPVVTGEPKQLAEGAENAGNAALSETEDKNENRNGELETDLTGIAALREAEESRKLSPMKTVAEIEAEFEAEIARENIESVRPETQRAAAVRKLLSEQTVREPEIIAGTLRSWLRES